MLSWGQQKHNNHEDSLLKLYDSLMIKLLTILYYKQNEGQNDSTGKDKKGINKDSHQDTKQKVQLWVHIYSSYSLVA